ncbi:MFS transporter [Humibacter sp.]|uniref:MFS transporter n=1 Tax=Humibacter sp. TaxID=1940291 RepID=UPI003F80C578
MTVSEGMSAGPVDARTVLARQDRIPSWSLPWWHLAVIGIGYFFTFFDIADIGYGMPAIAAQFKLTGSEATFVALAVGLIGYVVGSIVIGSISDRVGRYKILLVTIGITALGSFLCATATDMWTLSLWRFLTGVGVGADLNLVSTYVGELAPARQRGRISNLTFLVGILGQAVTPFVALALVPAFPFGWRLLFVVGGLIALIGLIARFQLPESPRWLALHGKPEEADAVVTRMEEIARSRGMTLPEPEPEDVSMARDAFPMRSLIARPYLGRLVLLVLMWFFWYIGNYGFLGDATTLLSGHGFAIADSILFLGVGAIGYPVGAIVMAVLADKLDRRLLILGSTCVWLIGMLLLGSLAGDTIVTIGSFLASFALGLYLQVAYTYTAELFPTRARASGFSLSDGIGHSGGVVGALLLPVVVTAGGFFLGFAGIGITGLIAGLIALFGPKTSGRRLESVSK